MKEIKYFFVALAIFPVTPVVGFIAVYYEPIFIDWIQGLLF